MCGFNVSKCAGMVQRSAVECEMVQQLDDEWATNNEAQIDEMKTSCDLKKNAFQSVALIFTITIGIKITA